MSEHQRETAFLRQCILYDDSGEGHKLQESITQLQRNERCVRRAVWLMALLAALAMAGLCYAAVFMADNPLNTVQFTAQWITKVLCALGIGSLICLLAFTALGSVYRKDLDQRREECRRLARSLMESRLGKPRALEATAPEISSAEAKA
jgi:formate hydrogenlyase subunit 3/multisubunit Na+/H+ antiporter MnhD subunit